MKNKQSKTTETPVTGISIAAVTPKPVKSSVLSKPKPNTKPSKRASAPVAKPEPTPTPSAGTATEKGAAEQVKAERVTSNPAPKKSGSAKLSAKPVTPKATAKSNEEPSALQRILASPRNVRPVVPEPRRKADGTPDWGGSCYFMGQLVWANIPLKEALTEYYFKAYPYGGAPKAVACFHNWEKRIEKGIAKAAAKSAPKATDTKSKTSTKSAPKGKGARKPNTAAKSDKQTPVAVAA